MSVVETFVVDSKGRKTGVVLSLKRYRKLVDDLHDFTFKASVDKDLTDLSKNLVARVWQRFELLKQ